MMDDYNVVMTRRLEGVGRYVQLLDIAVEVRSDSVLFA